MKAEEMDNPFRTPSNYAPSGYTEIFDTDGRLARLKEFNGNQLRAVLEIPDIQVRVRTAAERKLRRIEKPIHQYDKSEKEMNK